MGGHKQDASDKVYLFVGVAFFVMGMTHMPSGAPFLAIGVAFFLLAAAQRRRGR